MSARKTCSMPPHSQGANAFTRDQGENATREVWRRDESSPQNNNAFCQGSFELPIRSCIKNQKLPNRLSLQNGATLVKPTDGCAVPSGSHFKLASKRWCYAGQGLNDVTLLRQSKMERGS